MNHSDFENIFHKHYSPLCNYACKYTSDATVAEEIVQNLFVQIWEKDALEEIENPEAYLMQATKYKCKDYFRHKNRNRIIQLGEIPDFETEEIYDISDDDVEPLMHYFAAKLPDKTRQVFLLSRKSGLTYKEIAEEMELSVKTVENQMGRALRLMREILKKHNFMSLIPFL